MIKRPNPNVPNALSIYDGQERAGCVVKDGNEYFAFDASGRCLGSFDSTIEAAKKIPPAKVRETVP